MPGAAEVADQDRTNAGQRWRTGKIADRSREQGVIRDNAGRPPVAGVPSKRYGGQRPDREAQTLQRKDRASPADAAGDDMAVDDNDRGLGQRHTLCWPIS